MAKLGHKLSHPQRSVQDDLMGGGGVLAFLGGLMIRWHVLRIACLSPSVKVKTSPSSQNGSKASG